ncbi:hypothetical protein PYW08_016147 [Mythimna loreyi]|uniref:Uncharacterized protein n=1 Tax=Mythimna loreyi TaxID=667449 RepID=A0ACC2QSP8_9NEOP|nr:hypothetical protein PYW08_016147 [Mythimna loreyi]
MVSSGTHIINVPGVGDKSEKYSSNGINGAREPYGAGAIEVKKYDYEEAINIAGNGCYNYGLLAVLSLSLMGMGIDIFGFSVIVTGSSCDFQLEHWQKNIMLSMPFVGPIVMSIAWGYISDTQGRRKALLIALWGSFLSSFISAFSPNWITLAVLKVFSSSFCSAVQSVAYALLNESCTTAIKGVYMLIMTSVLMLFLLSYVVPAYFILQLNFAYNIGLLLFTPWRLLTILMAAPLGISAFFLHFHYESPKFLVNVGREEQALEFLAKIWTRNGNKDKYPVQKVVLHEDLSFKNQDINILKSLWLQTIPLFKAPLIWRTLQLFYLTAVIYGSNNSFVMWMPYIIGAFTSGTNSSNSGDSRSLCSILKSTVDIPSSTDSPICSSSIQFHTLLSGITHGLVFASITLVISKLASWKKLLMITFLLIPGLSSLGAIFNQNDLASLILYVGMTMTNLCMGVLFSYFVELYPTSYSGMAACLGVMVARSSGLAGVNFLGSFVTTHCTMTFYIFTGFLMSGVIVAMFLPPDIKVKEV